MALSPLFLLLAALASPQDSPRSQVAQTASPLGVLRFSWRTEHILPLLSFSPLFRADAGLVPPGAGPPQPIGGDSSTLPRLGRRRLPAELNPPGMLEPDPVITERYLYSYSVKVRNLAPLSIRTVVWDYVFREPGSGVVQALVQFHNEENIKPGESKTLKGYTERPPGNVASVAALKDTARKGESIEILEVVFSDHSVWRHPLFSW
jgi:hypothetical protein